jgi:hypothetical protein
MRREEVMKKKVKKPTKPKAPEPGSPGTLNLGETHPASQSAFRYVVGLGIVKQSIYLESFSSCAIEGNRLGEICGETLRRVMNGEQISDRYICALAYTIKEMEEDNAK